uniref:Uncharacterized protein n=1 Tax=Geospiza parvula TaxID=87175 RepID=A0A8C3QCC7_GEOPR
GRAREPPPCSSSSAARPSSPSSSPAPRPSPRSRRGWPSFRGSPEDQVLLHAGTPLDDEAALGQSPLPEFTTLDLSTRLLGGKVHGSLARAGKVRGQTPKVAKQEKKKKKTGRAKRRMQYNRRCVNVVPTFGKKKGPNANS